MATRSAPRVPKFTKEQTAKAIKLDDTARAAKRTAKRMAKEAVEAAERETQQAAHDLKVAEQAATRDKAAEREAHLATLRVDWEALGSQGTFEAFVAENEAAPDDGAPKAKREQTYFGPMLALRKAAVNYVKAANGILCNGDQLASAVGHLDRDDVCKALIAAMKLEGNPYTHLNPGQQSMNLRNKARAMMKAGTLTIAEVRAAANTPAEVVEEEGEEDDE